MIPIEKHDKNCEFECVFRNKRDICMCVNRLEVNFLIRYEIVFY